MVRLLASLVLSCLILGLPIEGSFVPPYPHVENNQQGTLDYTHNQPLVFKPSGDEPDSRPLYGRFLQITDIHPDPHYKPFADPDTACHTGVNENTGFHADDTGIYGLPVSRCDSPDPLVNATFEWIRENIRDNIDFIVWTGDNVRHDRDRVFPRTQSEVLESNEKLVSVFRDVFGTDNPFFPYQLPIIPNIGNNDVYPHNLVDEGPTIQSREFYRIYSGMVPQEQAHIFNKGMYFMKEVIPGKLAVISLNTLFWFDTNPVVDGCDIKKDPGHVHFRWLGVVLKELRSRGMKAWVSGHVPPTKDNWEPTCRDRYIAWTHEYRDVIIGGLFGHMNIDHFVVHDIKEAYKQKKEEGAKIMYNDDPLELLGFDDSFETEEEEEEYFVRSRKPKQAKPYVDFSDHTSFTMQGKADYFDSLRLAYQSCKTKSKKDIRYSISNVHASVIPTYFPGFRVYEYNIDGLTQDNLIRPTIYADGTPFKPWKQVFDELDEYLTLIHQLDDDSLDELDAETVGFHITGMLDATKKKKKKGKKKKGGKKKKIIDPTWPPEYLKVERGPAYDYQLFSPKKYTQYYLNLTKVNLKGENFGFEVEYETDKAPYNMKALTVKDWIDLAGNLTALPVPDDGKDNTGKTKSLWDQYLCFAFTSSGFEQDMT